MLDLDLIYVEGGTFLMGSANESGAYSDARPVHEVTLDSFFMAKYPVTQKLWKAVMGEKNNPSFFKGDLRPVEQVYWEDAQDFIMMLNRMTQETRKPGEAYRIPTEAEWEFAARGGNKSKGYQYAGSNKLPEVGWYYENSHEETKAVGQKQPNELGLYDMSGNVLEWCWDWYGLKYYVDSPSTNPKGPLPHSGLKRVARGGSWANFRYDCEVAFRTPLNSSINGYQTGFRLVLSPIILA